MQLTNMYLELTDDSELMQNDIKVFIAQECLKAIALKGRYYYS